MTNDITDFQTLHEFAKVARTRLSQNAWDYLIGGAETETTLKRNRYAIDSLALRPRVLRDVSAVDASTRLFGHKVRPAADPGAGRLGRDLRGGRRRLGAKAAGEFGIFMMLSSVTKPGLEAVAKAGTGPKIFQLYVAGRRRLHRRARQAGGGQRLRRLLHHRRHRALQPARARHRQALRQVVARRRHRPRFSRRALSWDDIARFKATHKVPLILKGIGTGEDAAKAVSLGVDGVYVSNHGGRQLDQGRGSLDVLPEVVEAVKGRARIIVDGSFLRAPTSSGDGAGRRRGRRRAAVSARPGCTRPLGGDPPAGDPENEIITGMACSASANGASSTAASSTPPRQSRCRTRSAPSAAGRGLLTNPSPPLSRRRGTKADTNPPLTCRVWPVMKLACSEAKEHRGLAMSIGWPMRPAGSPCAMRRSPPRCCHSAAAPCRSGPARLALTRMRCGASSSAMARVIATTPPLLAV